MFIVEVTEKNFMKKKVCLYLCVCVLYTVYSTHTFYIYEKASATAEIKYRRVRNKNVVGERLIKAVIE